MKFIDGTVYYWLYLKRRMASTFAALAQGDSQNSLLSNIGRVMGLGPALGAALAGAPIAAVAASGLFGETLACWVAFRRLEKRDKIPFSESLRIISMLTIILAASGFVWWFMVQQLNFFLTALIAVAGTFISGVLIILRSKELRQGTLYLWSAFSNGGWHGLWACFKAEEPHSN
jgi:hypothetical protein